MSKPTNLMTVDERRLHEAITGESLPPQTDAERNEALRLAAAEAWQFVDERDTMPGPNFGPFLGWMDTN